MEISKLKLELYDLAAIVLPGFFLMAEITIVFMGWSRTLTYAKNIHGTELTLLLLCSFALGNLVQEAADRLIKLLVGKRFFRQPRDRIWESDLRKDICEKIRQLGGPITPSVDAAFDLCLTYLDGSFPKRDAFLAIADLSRSLFVLSIMLILPAVRAVVFAHGTVRKCLTSFEAVIIVTACASLSWSRMVRFRAFSETPVFHAFLAKRPQTQDQSESGEENAR